MNKHFHIETFGCQMNKSDSELIALSLLRSGYIECSSEVDADILVVNTCSVRQHAENRIVSRIRAVKNKLKCGSIVVLAGCMAQRIGESLLGHGLADIVIGPYQSPRIGEIISEYLKDKDKNIFISSLSEDFSARIDFGLANKKDHIPWHKWVTITHGCENFCSYCIVPYVRGPLISFPSDLIIKYVKELANNGIKEVTLLGQNVNQYGMNNDIPFHKLLEKISGIKGLERISFLTSHPKDFDENIINVIRDNENISRSIHIPVQSGSNAILKAMNRQYTIEHYLKIIERINKTLSNYSISTDIIVGFPGESLEDFNATLDFIKRIRFDEAFTYAYSARQGTTAYKLEETMTRKEKIARLNILIDLQRKISREKLAARLNGHEEMIVERISRRSGKEVMGRTFLNHPVITPGLPADIGRKIKIKITDIKGSTLYGKRIA